jgi:glutaconate CoA-transferase, subunit B
MTTAYAVADLMACVIARLLRDGETVFFGLASPLAMLGVLLAKHTHAPNATILNIPGGMGDAVARLPRSTVDASLTGGSRYLFSLAEVFDLSARGRLDTVLLSGVQIDRQGRINMSVIGAADQPRVALPGGAGSALLLPTAGRTLLWRSKHDARTFVERLDYVTAAGATSHVVTPLCLFERRADLLEVASIHPGVALEALQQATGWPVAAAPETPSPTPTELALLARLDPENVRAAEF